MLCIQIIVERLTDRKDMTKLVHYSSDQNLGVVCCPKGKDRERDAHSQKNLRVGRTRQDEENYAREKRGEMEEYLYGRLGPRRHADWMP